MLLSVNKKWYLAEIIYVVRQVRSNHRTASATNKQRILRTFLFFYYTFIYCFLLVQRFGSRVISRYFYFIKNIVVINISGNRCTGYVHRFLMYISYVHTLST